MRMLWIAVLAAGCASGTAETRVLDVLPAPAALPGALVSTEELAARLGEADLVVVQVSKERTAYDAGHVPGARFLPYKALAVVRNGVKGMLPEPDALMALVDGLGIGPSTKVVFYDDEGGTWAARGWVVMDLLGHPENAALLDGQLAKWRAEGRPLETVEAKASPLLLKYEWPVDGSVIADLPAVKAMVAEKTRAPGAPIALLDARPPEEFSGAKPGEDVTRAGHIPGAASLPWQELVESGANPVLRSPSEIRALLGAASGGDGSLLVAHCRTGRQASLLYFAARYVGRPVRLYDGSFLEWQSDPANLVE